MLTEPQRERYARQWLLPEVGVAGQERLLAARVELRAHGAAAEALRRNLIAAGVSLAGEEGTRAATRVASPEAPGDASWLLGAAGVVRVGPSLCRECAAAWLLAGPRPPGWAAEVAAQAVGSLAASQVLLELLGRAPVRPSAWSVWPRFEHAEPPARVGCRCA